MNRKVIIFELMTGETINCGEIEGITKERLNKWGRKYIINYS